MKRPVIVALACVAVALAGWMLWQKSRGPVLAGYQLQAQPLVQTVVATGRVVAVSRAQVGSPVTGVVVERRVREGDTVAPGDVLAVLRADDLEAAVREAEAAFAQLQQARRPQAQAVQREAEARLAQASREVARRRDLFRRQLIARAGATEVLAAVDEKNLEVLAVGQKAMCVADAYPARPFPAVVGFIAPAVDPQRGSVDVRFAVDPVPDFLRQDMTVSVNVETGRRERAIVAPNDALAVDERGQASVWRVASGRVQRRQVTLGLRGLTRSEITAGLAAGDWILADARAAVEEGARVRVEPSALPVGAADSATRKELPAKLD